MPSVAMTSKEDAELMERLRANDAFLRSAINLIPIDNWGFDEKIRDRLKQRKHRLVNEKLTQPQKARLSKAVKQRLSKADPNVCRTVTEVWDWMASTKLTDNAPKPQFKSKKELAAGSSTSESQPTSGATPSLVNGKDSKQPSKGGKAEKKRKLKEDASKQTTSSSNGAVESSNASLNPLSSRQEAMRRLHEKIDELQAKRRGSKTNAADYAEKMRLKRRLSKLKLKDKRKEEKKKATTQQKDSKADEKNAKPSTPKKPRTEQKPITTTDDGKLVFSKFDFVVKPQNAEKKEAKNEKKRMNRDKLSGKDYKRLLEKVEKRKEKIASIREKDSDKADRLEKNIKWNSAMQRAEGVKVKDNVELLKKGLKRKEQMKVKSKKKWAQREQSVVQHREKRQEKRETNLAQRKETVKNKKIDRARKRGRKA